MKVYPRDVDTQVTKLSPQYLAVLVFGPDEGLVRERSSKIAKQVVQDLKDPFLVANIDPNNLKSEPGLLADEAAAISMMGGRRVIRIDGASENATKAAQAFLENRGTVLNQRAHFVRYRRRIRCICLSHKWHKRS